MKEGKPLDRGQLQESMRLLFSTGRFTDLRAECEHNPDGKIILSFANTPKYFIGLVRVEGAPGRPTESQMANASKLQLGEPFTKDKIDRAVDNINSLLRENEFYNAKISFTQHENPQTQQVEIIFDVHSGDPARVGSSPFRAAASIRWGKLRTSRISIPATSSLRKKSRMRWIACESITRSMSAG